jgi:hypothetical protein
MKAACVPLPAPGAPSKINLMFGLLVDVLAQGCGVRQASR